MIKALVLCCLFSLHGPAQPESFAGDWKVFNFKTHTIRRDSENFKADICYHYLTLLRHPICRVGADMGEAKSFFENGIKDMVMVLMVKWNAYYPAVYITREQRDVFSA